MHESESAVQKAAISRRVGAVPTTRQPHMKLLFVVACAAAAEHHAPLLHGTRPALLQRRESDLLASKEELPERTYTGRASVFDVFRAMEDEGAKRMSERPSEP